MPLEELGEYSFCAKTPKYFCFSNVTITFSIHISRRMEEYGQVADYWGQDEQEEEEEEEASIEKPITPASTFSNQTNNNTQTQTHKRPLSGSPQNQPPKRGRGENPHQTRSVTGKGRGPGRPPGRVRGRGRGRGREELPKEAGGQRGRSWTADEIKVFHII